MKTYLHLKKTFREELPLEFRESDLRYPESLVEHFLQEFTRAGDVVFDPFAGFGTTLDTAERMGRVAYGVELNYQRVSYARSRMKRPERLIHGDARQLASLELPPIDLAMTSPPFMSRGDAEDPLTDSAVEGKGYSTYLRDLRKIFGQLRTRMKPAGQVVIEVSNLKIDGRLTTLAWDLANEVSRVLHFEGEVIACWDEYGYGYDHSYCLVYSAF